MGRNGWQDPQLKIYYLPGMPKQILRPTQDDTHFRICYNYFMNPSGEKHQLWERRQAELWDRIFQVTQDVVVLADSFEDTSGGVILKQEMVKAAMQVGSHLVRATASDDRPGFYDHLHEAKMKAVETDYWLRLAYVLQQREDVQKDLSSIITQYGAVIELLQKMMRHMRDEKDAVSRHVKGPRVSL